MFSLAEVFKILFPGVHGRGKPVSFRERNWEEQRTKKKEMPNLSFRNNKIIRDNVKYGRRRFGVPDWQFWPSSNSRIFSDSEKNVFRIPLEMRFFLGWFFSKRIIVFIIISFIFIVLFELGEDDTLDDIWSLDDLSYDRNSTESSDAFVLEGVEEADELDFDFAKNEDIDFNDEIRLDYFCSLGGTDELAEREIIVDIELSAFFYNPILYNLYKSNQVFYSILINYHDYLSRGGISTSRFIDKRLWSNYYLLMFDSYLSMDSNSGVLMFNWPTNYKNPFTVFEQNPGLSEPDTFVDTTVSFNEDLSGYSIRKPVNSMLGSGLELHKTFVLLEFVSLATLAKKIEKRMLLPRVSSDWDWKWVDVV